MGTRQRRRDADTATDISRALGTITGTMKFSSEDFSVSNDDLTQQTMFGEIPAVRNTASVDRSALSRVLGSIPTVYDPHGEMTEKYINEAKFWFLCGSCDRFVAITDAVSSLVRQGVKKIVIAADTRAEMINLTRSLELMKGSLSGAEITAYSPEGYDTLSIEKIAMDIEGFLMSNKPQIFVIGRDSFSRCTNVIFTTRYGSPMCESIANTHPVLITSSRNTDSARCIAANAEIFNPSLTLMFAQETKKIHGAVIYSPHRAYNRIKETRENEQIGF